MLRQQKLLTVDAFPVQVRFEKYFFLAFFAGFNPGLVRTHWWLRSYSSQALEGYKLKAECLFLICLVLLFALNVAIFGTSLQIFNFESTTVARCLDGL